MFLAGTQMHIATFIFVCIEIVIFFYLVIYRLARPDDKITTLNIVLIFLLLTYNITGGLLPDANLPGSFFIQNVIAYATGFITPCYFPYYVYKAFGLNKMKFHAYKGVFFYLMTPYLFFVIVFAASGDLEIAKNILILPVLYALWVIYSLLQAIRFKYKNNFSSKASKEEITVLVLSISPWIGLPVITYFNQSQTIEVLVTNTGFLLLFTLQVSRHVKQLKTEHQRLVDSELKLLDWNKNLKIEVEKRTNELEKINEQKTNTFVNLAHETKTPLTLINNYLEEYINTKGNSEELLVVKKNIEKLSNDIVNFFDLERFNKGIAIYNHNQVSDFSEILKDSVVLFKEYAKKKNIQLFETIENELFIKADPVSINRVVNNLIENAIKFSVEGVIYISLQREGDEVIFSVKDPGIGIPPEMHKKIFEPYYQISNHKKSIQGMGLGLPIVKKIIQDLCGEIKIGSNFKKVPGTEVNVKLKRHVLKHYEEVSPNLSKNISLDITNLPVNEIIYDECKSTIVIIEDNAAMITFLIKKLSEHYNVYFALNGNEALTKIKSLSVIPDLIISDIMMDKVDGYSFAKIISESSSYNHIPIIFLSAKSSYSDKLKGLKAGAIDYISKPFSISELLQKIESILTITGKQRKAVIGMAMRALNSKDTLPATTENTFDQNCQQFNLTSREREISKLICQGYKYKDIADTLFIAERTVTKHVQNIFEKVEVSNKIELCNKLED